MTIEEAKRKHPLNSPVVLGAELGRVIGYRERKAGAQIVVKLKGSGAKRLRHVYPLLLPK